MYLKLNDLNYNIENLYSQEGKGDNMSNDHHYMRSYQHEGTQLRNGAFGRDMDLDGCRLRQSGFQTSQRVMGANLKNQGLGYKLSPILNY